MTKQDEKQDAREELELEPETVKDLDVDEPDAERVQGGTGRSHLAGKESR